MPNWYKPDPDTHLTTRADRLCNALIWICATVLGLQILPTLIRYWINP